MPNRLQSLQSRRAALHHKMERHRTQAIRLFEQAAAEMAKAKEADVSLALMDREINAIVDTTLDRMTTTHREIHNQ